MEITSLSALVWGLAHDVTKLQISSLISDTLWNIIIRDSIERQVFENIQQQVEVDLTVDHIIWGDD